LMRASPVFSKASQTISEATYLNSAFDAMGKICAVQARILATSRAKPIQMITDDDVPMSNHTSTSAEEEVKCHCQESLEDVLVLACDHCNTFFHGQCVGFPDAESIPEQWSCDACCLGKIAVREQRKLSNDEAAFIDQNYALHHSFQAVTAHKLGVENLDDAVHFHLARWVDELERRGLMDVGLKNGAHPRKIIARLLEHWDVPGPAAEPLTDEGGVRVVLAVLANTSPLFRAFRKQIGFLLRLMADESTHSLRKLSLKVVEKTVEGDASLMLLPIITKAVSRRFSDESISVREAAVSLVGNYAVKTPLAMQSYHSALLPCLKDPGVSVRKRAVKIFQTILTQNPRYKGRSAVCNILLQRSADPKEEDAVRDLIDDTFCILWLRNGNQELSPEKKRSDLMDDDDALPVKTGQASSIPGVVTPSTPFAENKRKKKPLVRSDVSAEQMMECVRAGGTGEPLEALLQKLLNGSIDSDSSRKQSERRKRQELGIKECTRLVDSLFELLMVVEEQRQIRASPGKDIAATLTTIGVFATVCPFPILKHLDTVLPYLKADNGVSPEDESAIVVASCDIIYRLSSVFDKTTVARIASTSAATDLTKICYKFGPAAINGAVRAFSSIAHHPDAGEKCVLRAKLLKLAKTFYKFLLTNKAVESFDGSKIPSKTKNSTHRALTVLGLLCENHEEAVDSDTWGNEDNLDLVPLDELEWDNFTPACYRLFSLYLHKRDSGTKCKALAALKGVFLAHPYALLSMDHLNLFDKVMHDDAGIPLNLEALECWKNILAAEERRIDSGMADAKMDADGTITVSKRISGDQDGDATLFGGVLTSHADRLFEMLHSKHAVIRKSTLELLGLLLRQGLVNPNEAVPFLFALQGDTENEIIRSLALQLLITEGEKRPDILRQRISAGVKQAYNFQRSVYPEKAQVSSVVKKGKSQITSIFDTVFPCIATNCWVIPPASPATTLALRIVSSSCVLP